MGDVTLISSTIIRPKNANQSDQTKIHLTPFDLNLLYLDYPQRGLLFPKPDPETHFISRLKSSLSTALEVYYPFAGRLVEVTNLEYNTVSFHIDCDNTSGAKFIHAVAESVSVSEFLQPNGSIPNSFSSFFPANRVRCYDGLSNLLLALQVTEMKDGVFISFGYNHLVADGVSMWNFFNNWSKICLIGHKENIQPLVLKDWFLTGIDYPIRIPVFEAETQLNRDDSPEASTKEIIFHFTKENISDLKAKVNNEIGLSEVKISSLQSVLAYLWRKIIRQSGLNLEEDTHCKIAVDLRQRLNPPLGKECFGNVISTATATATVRELMDHDLSWVALKLNESVKSLTDESCVKFAENWVKKGEIPRIDVRSIMGDNSLIVTSSPWFNVYDNDFGLGKPVAVRAGPANGIGGKLVVFRGVEEGSFDVHVILALSLWSPLLLNLNLSEDIESIK